jgi:hypothetical protein
MGISYPIPIPFATLSMRNMRYFLAGDRRSGWLARDPVLLCLVKCSDPVAMEAHREKEKNPRS